MKKTILLFISLVLYFSISAQSVYHVGDNTNAKVLTTKYLPIDLLSNISVYPNPVSDVMRISLRSENNELAKLSVMNTIGKKVLSEDYLLEEGNNIIEVKIKANSIEPGIYFLILTVDNSRMSRKIIVR